MPKGNCEFNGTGKQYLVIFIVHIFLLSLLTIGIYSPWAWVRLLRLRASHTRINGNSMTFAGTGGQLFALGLLNGLLTIITLGIYWPWAVCRISAWKAQNTLVGGRPSEFVGTGGRLFVFSLIHFVILPALTFGLYAFYGMYRYYAWKQEHFRYGGAKTSFGAGFWGFLKIYLIIAVVLIFLPAVGAVIHFPAMEWLAPLICLLVSPWLIAMFFDWETRGLMVGDEEGVAHFPPVKTRFLWVLVFILIVLGTVAAVALLVKEQLGPQLTQMGNLGRFLEMKRDDTANTGLVRGRVKRPLPGPGPAGVTPPLQKAPAAKATSPAGADKGPSAGKNASESLAVPVWTPLAEEPLSSTDTYERQIRELDAFIQKDAQNAEAYYSRGCLYARVGDLKRAEADLTRAIEINRRNSDAFYNRGLVLARQNDFELAINDFDEAIELTPRAADAYCNRGSAYLELGKLDLAMTDYAKALKIKPDDPDLYYNRGLVYLSQGRTAEARADFKKAADLKGRSLPETPGQGSSPPSPVQQ